MQAPAYNRTTDFASRDGDETDHAALNAELDGAAQSINALRHNQALIQADDGSLKAGVVGADALAPDAFDAVLGAVADSVDAAQAASQSALTSAVTAGNSAAASQGSADSALTSQNAAGLAAQVAAQAAQDCADALAASQLVPEQLVHKDGSVAMTAGLPLSGNAAQPLHAVPLQQAQALATAAQAAATGAAAGLYLRKDGAGPMTAGLPLAGDAAQPLHAVPLQQVQALIDAAVAAAVAASTPPGTISPQARLAGSPGWLLIDGKTIGNAASGATARANADTFPLYEQVWAFPAGSVPIYDNAGAPSVRGASAAADFAAGKRLALFTPDGGAFLRMWAPGQTRDAGRAAGSDQLDAFQGHWHAHYSTGNITLAGDAAIEDGPRSGTSNAGTTAVTGPVSDGVNGAPRAAAETRPYNLAMPHYIKL